MSESTEVVAAGSEPSIAQIQAVVARHFGLSVLELTSRRQSRLVVVPRHAAMWLAEQLTTLSHRQIAQAFGRRDHSSLRHAVRRTEERFDDDMFLREEVAQLAAKIGETA